MCADVAHFSLAVSVLIRLPCRGRHPKLQLPALGVVAVGSQQGHPVAFSLLLALLKPCGLAASAQL